MMESGFKKYTWSFRRTLFNRKVQLKNVYRNSNQQTKTADRECDADLLPRNDKPDDPSTASHYRLPSLQGTPGSFFGVPLHESKGQHACGRTLGTLLGHNLFGGCISVIVSAPIGVFAAVYLNEYARESWFTRITNLAVVNLAGVPSIVHALYSVSAHLCFSRA